MDNLNNVTIGNNIQWDARLASLLVCSHEEGLNRILGSTVYRMDNEIAADTPYCIGRKAAADSVDFEIQRSEKLTASSISRSQGNFCVDNDRWIYTPDRGSSYIFRNNKWTKLSGAVFLKSMDILGFGSLQNEDNASEEAFYPAATAVFLNDRIGRNVVTVELGDGITSIGRSEDNTIVLSNSLVSNKHSYISIENGEFYITDDSSKNGVYKAGKRVEGKAPLAVIDAFSVVDTLFLKMGNTLLYTSHQTNIQVENKTLRIFSL